jgi:hypothetical protein
MDARGREPGGGRSTEVQSVPTQDTTRDHTNRDPKTGQIVGHMSIPGSPADTLVDLKLRVAEVAQLANETFNSYEAKHQRAIQKHTEAEQMNIEIATAVGKAQTNRDHIPSKFESERQNTESAGQLLKAIDSALRALADLSGEVDDAVGKIEEMPNTDGNIDGHKSIKTHKNP